MSQAVFPACPKKHNPGESTLVTPGSAGLPADPNKAENPSPDRRSDACSNNSHEGITTDIC